MNNFLRTKYIFDLVFFFLPTIKKCENHSTCGLCKNVWLVGFGHELEKEMAAHSSILAWRIPWTEKVGGLYSPWGHKELDMTESHFHL